MNTDRSDSTSHRLPALLVEQPVINTSYMAQHLGISERAARRLISQACERGILTKVGNARVELSMRQPTSSPFWRRHRLFRISARWSRVNEGHVISGSYQDTYFALAVQRAFATDQPHASNEWE